jgi:hypothetical protein
VRRPLLLAAVLAVGLAGCGAGARGGSGGVGTSSAGKGTSSAGKGTSSAGKGTSSGRVATQGSGGAAPVRLTLGAPGRAIPRGYLGLSTEFNGILAYTGDDPSAINPVFETLVRDLDPGQAPVLRIGGDSTDMSYVPAAGVTPRFTGGYRLTPRWLATTAALAHDLGAKMILGLNLADDQPALDAAQARAYLAAFGRESIAGFEPGNEPNLYAHFTKFPDRAGKLVTSRPPSYGPAGYNADVARLARALPPAARSIPLVGPALAAGLTTAGAQPWTSGASALLAGDPRVRILSVHRYPQKNCFEPHSSPMFPTIAHLVAPYSTVAFADGVRGWVRIAHRAGRTLRIDELNSAACKGRFGVSDTFASALWATDALFSLAAAGVDGVNVHTTTVPETAYGLFTFSHDGGRWTAAVRPDYYGLQLFAQAAPAGSRLLAVRGATHSPRLSAWGTRGADGRDRVVLIDKDPGHPETVRLPARGTVTVERMQAPGLTATSGVSLGGRSYGRATTSGRLGAMRVAQVRPDTGDDVTVTVPGASAALVTFPASAR